MAHRPKWRAPLQAGPKNPWQSPAFLAGREKARGTGVKCRCGAHALRGGTKCRRHGGLLGAAAAESERYGKPVIILRNPRRSALHARGRLPPPPEMPLPAWFDDLFPTQKGLLIEAFLNRELSPDGWRLALEKSREIAKTTRVKITT
jgi:hypothetical protein